VLDEYQDTNVAQAADPGRVRRRVPGHAVGDPDQNIYAWRGASLFNLMQFPDSSPGRRDARRAPPAVHELPSGARSSAAADRIIAELPAAQRPTPTSGSSRGRRTVRGGHGGPPPDEWTEARWIAERILAIRAEHRTTRGRIRGPVRKSRLFTPVQEAFGERASRPRWSASPA
jgi:superfamily I DNA/RNA helicase